MKKKTHSRKTNLVSEVPIPDLVNRARTGGEDELNQLLSDKRVQAMIWGLCRWQFSRDSRGGVHFEELLDFCSDVKLKILKGLPKLKEIGDTKQFSTWVFRVVRSVRIDRNRCGKPETVDEPFDGYINAIASQELDPEAICMVRETERNIAAFIDLLPDELKRVMHWKLADGLSNREVAQRLGRSHPYVAKQLRFIRRLFEASSAFQQFKMKGKPYEQKKSRSLPHTPKDENSTL